MIIENLKVNTCGITYLSYLVGSVRTLISNSVCFSSVTVPVPACADDIRHSAANCTAFFIMKVSARLELLVDILMNEINKWIKTREFRQALKNNLVRNINPLSLVARIK